MSVKNKKIEEKYILIYNNLGDEEWIVYFVK